MTQEILNPPAFPLPIARQLDGNICASDQVVQHGEGMSLRDWFAGQVATGYVSLVDNRTCPKERIEKGEVEQWRKELAFEDAKYCYEFANALLSERMKHL